MTVQSLSNISLSDFQRFLADQGLNKVKTAKGRGGHEKWTKLALDRPIIIQTHVDPVPEFIVKQVLRHLKMSRSDFASEFNKKGKTKK